jgi:hypothetical protein
MFAPIADYDLWRLPVTYFHQFSSLQTSLAWLAFTEVELHPILGFSVEHLLGSSLPALICTHGLELGIFEVAVFGALCTRHTLSCEPDARRGAHRKAVLFHLNLREVKTARSIQTAYVFFLALRWS